LTFLWCNFAVRNMPGKADQDVQRRNRHARWKSLAVELKRCGRVVDAERVEREVRNTGLIPVMCGKVLDVVMPALYSLMEGGPPPNQAVASVAPAQADIAPDETSSVEVEQVVATLSDHSSRSCGAYSLDVIVIPAPASTSTAAQTATTPSESSSQPGGVRREVICIDSPEPSSPVAGADTNATPVKSAVGPNRTWVVPVGPPANTQTPPTCPNPFCNEPRPMVIRTGREGKPFWACVSSRFGIDGCKTMRVGTGEPKSDINKIRDADAPVSDCGVRMLLRNGVGRGLFYGCPNYRPTGGCACKIENLTASWKCPRGSVTENPHGCVLRQEDIPSVELPKCLRCGTVVHILKHNREYVVQCACSKPMEASAPLSQ
jgi:hypothetical protein